jgi:hypothetical protein
MRETLSKIHQLKLFIKNNEYKNELIEKEFINKYNLNNGQKIFFIDEKIISKYQLIFDEEVLRGFENTATSVCFNYISEWLIFVHKKFLNKNDDLLKTIVVHELVESSTELKYPDSHLMAEKIEKEYFVDFLEHSEDEYQQLREKIKNQTY